MTSIYFRLSLLGALVSWLIFCIAGITDTILNGFSWIWNRPAYVQILGGIFLAFGILVQLTKPCNNREI